MNTDLKNILTKIVDKTISAGANECDAIISKGSSFSLAAQNGDLEKYKVSGSQVIGVRAIADNKVGLAYTESLDESSLELAAQAAVANAKNSEVNEFESIQIIEGEHIYESQYEKDSASTEEKIDLCLKLESEVKARDSRVQSVPYNGFTESESEFYYLNNHGVSGFQSDYNQSIYTSALINEGETSGMHYQGAIGRKLSELDLEYCVSESLLHASEWLKGKPLSTGHYDIIFKTSIFGDLLGTFGTIFSARSAMEKTNPFADKIGQKVMNDKITISDLPQYKDTFSPEYFDAEGVAHKDLVLIQNGELHSFYHNTATANFFKTTTTGHATRGAKSPLSVSGTTKVISAGTISEEDIVAGEYFEVMSIQGLHSGANSASGEFSFAASGYLCRDGKRIQPVKGVTVSGNFYKMLLDVELLGDTIEATKYRHFFAPKIRFEKMSVAGV